MNQLLDSNVTPTRKEEYAQEISDRVCSRRYRNGHLQDAPGSAALRRSPIRQSGLTEHSTKKRRLKVMDEESSTLSLNLQRRKQLTLVMGIGAVCALVIHVVMKLRSRKNV